MHWTVEKTLTRRSKENIIDLNMNRDKKWYKIWWVIIIWVILGLTLLPFTIGGILIYFVIKKIKNSKLKIASALIIGAIILIFGSAWVIALTSPTPPKEKASNQQQKQNSQPEVKEQKKIKQSSPKSNPTFTSEIIPDESPVPQPTQISSLGVNRERVRVAKVVDGDTIKLENGKTVRYIGIDTPETVHPSKPIQCYGKEASNKNKELVEGKEIEIEKDVSETDKYSRLLRYIWIEDIFVNEYLVREGFAQSSSYPPDVKYQDRFREAERRAREEDKGLWGAYCDNWQELTITQQSSPADSQQDNNQVDTTGSTCSSDIYNCSDFTTHAEAQTVFEKCGGVSNDVHRLDANKDGSACESLP